MGRIFDVTRALVLFAVGLIITFFLRDDGYFAPILTLNLLSDVSPTLVVISGVLAMIAGVCILIRRTMIVGYIIGVAVTGTYALCYIATLFAQAPPHSVLGLLLIPGAISYAGGMYLALEAKYGIPREVEDTVY